jgi:16S rRNA (cytosine967-C5)-methyltransferase
VTPGGRIRAAAARAVTSVAHGGRTLEVALADGQVPAVARAAVQSLAYGTVRWHIELAALLRLLTDKPRSKIDPDVESLVLVGLFQLLHGETPEHAAVAETVEAVRVLGKARSAGFINALLRRFQRERAALLERAHASLPVRLAHPQWLVDAVQADWPAHWESMLTANNGHPPMWLRVNARRGSRDAYRARLAEAGIEATDCPFAPEALRLARPMDVGRLPGFAEGDVSVQDAAAQLAAVLLDARPGERVLDACAAPGGKACHVLETTPGLASLTALDSDPDRVGRITENLGRLGLAAAVVTGDAGRPADWWDGRPFERILLDVPCSGTGVIRRHPDIKLLRRATDIPALAANQARLLEALWPLLAPGGRLVYASCSVIRAENAGVVGTFLARTPGAVDVTESVRLPVVGLPSTPGPGPGYALLTGAADTDGFYYACLKKQA